MICKFVENAVSEFACKGWKTYRDLNQISRSLGWEFNHESFKNERRKREP